jgi:hypothetical protein
LTIAQWRGRHGARLPKADQFPEFEGEEAWFRGRWFSKRRFEVIQQVADKHGAPLVAEA